jgi:RimJ/RimL family protein N-acetyltransferase
MSTTSKTTTTDRDAGARRYPRLASEGGEIELRPLAAGDADAVLAFARRLAPHDLLFLPRDISEPKVVAAWVDAARSGAMFTLLATRGGEVHGCATIASDPLSWSRHVGELRVIVDAALRGQGLGQKLTQEAFAVALEQGLEKLTAQMTVDQRGAIAVFEGLGFKPEALLREHVKDRDGRAHDIVILSHDVARFHAQMTAYGLGEATAKD